MDNLSYLFAVFSIVWVVISFYLLSLIRGQRKLRREIQLMAEALEEKSSDSR